MQGQPAGAQRWPHSAPVGLGWAQKLEVSPPREEVTHWSLAPGGARTSAGTALPLPVGKNGLVPHGRKLEDFGGHVLGAAGKGRISLCGPGLRPYLLLPLQTVFQRT